MKEAIDIEREVNKARSDYGWGERNGINQKEFYKICKKKYYNEDEIKKAKEERDIYWQNKIRQIIKINKNISIGELKLKTNKEE